MNLMNTVFLTVTGLGNTPEEAGANFGQAFNDAMAAEPTLGSREYVDAFTSISPMLPTFTPDGSFGGYQLHARVAFERQVGDPQDGWEFQTLPV